MIDLKESFEFLEESWWWLIPSIVFVLVLERKSPKAIMWWNAFLCLFFIYLVGNVAPFRETATIIFFGFGVVHCGLKAKALFDGKAEAPPKD